MRDNTSNISDTSSKLFNEESRAKIDSLITAFEELGWDSQKDLTQDEVRFFLNRSAKDGQFDINLTQKLFSILDIDDTNRITGEEFIKGFLQFESDLKRNNDEFNRKFLQEQNTFNNLEEQCRLYKSEKLSPEGFCENAKITVEITDVVIQKPIEGINAIIIKVIYNDAIKEAKLEIGSNNIPVNQRFEFKPTSRRDHFEFIMKKIDDQNQESDIGSKVFPLDEITSQEEYIVQITIPEIEDEDQAAAFINCKIELFWSDYEFYEEKKKKSEQKLKKLNEALSKTSLYLQKIREVYGDLKKNEINISNNMTNNISNVPQDHLNNQLMIEGNNINNYYDNNNAGYDAKEQFIRSPNNYQNNESPSTKIGNLRGQKYGLDTNPNNQLMASDNAYNDNKIPFKGKKQIQFFGLCMILMGLIGSLKRPDFPNLLGGIFVVWCCNIGTRRGMSRAITWLKYVLFYILFLLIYDFLWLTTNYDLMWIDGYTGGNENFIGLLSVISCVGNILLKSLLGVLIFLQYNHIKNSQGQNSGSYC